MTAIPPSLTSGEIAKLREGLAFLMARRQFWSEAERETMDAVYKAVVSVLNRRTPRNRRPGEGLSMSYIDIVFDGPPSHESGRFVEVEDATGHSINAGEWIERPDGLWALRIKQGADVATEEQGKSSERRRGLEEAAKAIEDFATMYATEEPMEHCDRAVLRACESLAHIIRSLSPSSEGGEEKT